MSYVELTPNDLSEAGRRCKRDGVELDAFRASSIAGQVAHRSPQRRVQLQDEALAACHRVGAVVSRSLLPSLERQATKLAIGPDPLGVGCVGVYAIRNLKYRNPHLLAQVW